MTELLTPQELNDLGISKKEMKRMIRSGELIKVRRGFVTRIDRVSAVDKHKRLSLATMRCLSDGTYLSHFSAAVHHGLPVLNAALDHVYVTRPGSTHGQHRGVIRLSRARLHEDDIVEVDGLSMTSLARTTTDVARLSPLEWGVAAADAAIRLGMSEEELGQAVARSTHRKGNAKARAVLSLADGASESVLESISRVHMWRHEIPTPSLQFEVRHEGRLIGRSDFGWPEYGLLGECDGRIKYGTLLKPGETAVDAVLREKRREENLRQAGYWIVRWGWDEAIDGAKMVALIRNAMSMSQRRRSVA